MKFHRNSTLHQFSLTPESTCKLLQQLQACQHICIFIHVLQQTKESDKCTTAVPQLHPNFLTVQVHGHEIIIIIIIKTKKNQTKHKYTHQKIPKKPNFPNQVKKNKNKIKHKKPTQPNPNKETNPNLTKKNHKIHKKK